MTDFTLFGTDGCHLCEDAQVILQHTSVTFQVIDIMEKPEWQTAYGLLIPVLLHHESGQQLNWPFDEQAVVDFSLNSKASYGTVR